MKKINKLYKGNLAECYVMYRLALEGYNPVRIAGSSPVDIITAEGIRFEVKSSSGSKTKTTETAHYSYTFKRHQLEKVGGNYQSDFCVFVGWGKGTDPLYVVCLPIDTVIEASGGASNISIVTIKDKVTRISRMRGERVGDYLNKLREVVENQNEIKKVIEENSGFVE
jgi:hypothetical protein